MSSLTRSREETIRLLGHFWTQVFLDSDFVDSFATSFAVPFDSLNKAAESMGSYLSRYEIPDYIESDARIFLFSEADEDTVANRYGDEGLTYGDGSLYGESTLSSNNRTFPIDKGFSPKFLSVGIGSPGAVLVAGEDFTISNDSITFFEDPFSITGLSINPRPTTGGVTHRDFFLWGFQVREDINALCSFFGTMAGIYAISEAKAKEAVHIAWDLRVDGATSRNIKRLLGVLSDVDYVQQSGEVVDVFEEGDRLCVETENGVYTAPISATTTASIGDSLEEGDLIFDTFTIHTGNDRVPFEDFEGLALDKGYLPNIDGSLLFVNSRVAVERNTHPGWYTIQA